MMTFKEHAQLDDAFLNPLTVRLATSGIRLTLAGAAKLGKEITKLALPPVTINSAIKGTVIYTIAKKYDLQAIIEIQKYGVGLIVDVAKWMGLEIGIPAATQIFTKIVIRGGITLGAILLSVLAYTNRKKAREIYYKASLLASKARTKKLKSSDVANIRKTLRAA